MRVWFGDWSLVPCDGLNWELCHRHEVTRGRDAGTVKWVRQRRYYQWNTLPLAFLYAADWEVRHGHSGVVASVPRWLREHERVLQGFLGDLQECLEAHRDEISRDME